MIPLLSFSPDLSIFRKQLLKMSRFVQKYTISFNIDHFLIGSVVFPKIQDIERKTAVKFKTTRGENTITITGPREAVRQADDMILNIMEEHYFSAIVRRDMGGQILGQNRDNARLIKEEVGGHVYVDYNPDNLTAATGTDASSVLQVFGNGATFKPTMVRVMDAVESKIEDQFRLGGRINCFRQLTISRGIHEVSYVDGQNEPNPQVLFLTFDFTFNANEELYTPVKTSTTECKTPPGFIGKKAAILAPYKGFMYRAQVLNYFRADSRDDILLQVLFVDFGNVEMVSYFDTVSLPAKHLYPPIAVMVQLENVKQEKEEWSIAALKKFRQYLNKHTTGLVARTFKKYKSDDVIAARITLSEIGDIGELLIEKDLVQAAYPGPFDPDFVADTTPNTPNYGHLSMVYEKSTGYGGIVGLVVDSFSNTTDKLITYTSAMNDGSFVTAIYNAYDCASRIVTEKIGPDNELNNITLHFSTICQCKLNLSGSSAGAALTLGILSLIFKKQVPSNMIITGEILDDGSIFAVDGIRSKLLAAKNNGKTLFFVPKKNVPEAYAVRVEDVKIVGYSTINEVVEQIWKI